MYCGKENQDAYFCLFYFSYHTLVSVTDVKKLHELSTKHGYDKLFYESENQSDIAIISFICPFFFVSNKYFCLRFLSPCLSPCF